MFCVQLILTLQLLIFRKYVPCLKKFPSKYIFEPWDTPLSVQQKCGCIVGKDYPRPIVNHSKIVKKNMERMKKARMSAGTVDSSSDRQGMREHS